MPKTLITDPDRDTSPYNPNRPSYFNMQTKDNPNKKQPRGFTKKYKVWSPRSSDKQHSIHKEIQLTNRNYTKRGTSKPYPKNPYFQACT